jgi:small subunit ribosomal protein S2
MTGKMLVDADKYLKTGSHIGTVFKSGEMKRFVFKIRKDGLKVFDIQMIDDRIKTAAEFLARYPQEKIVAVSRKLYGQEPAKQFAEAVHGKVITGRFVPGTFTNSKSQSFVEPAIIIITEPESDSQAIAEAKLIRVPVIALASTNNTLKDIDFVIPINNKGRKSLALVYWLLAREILKIKGEIKKDEEFTKTMEDFEYKLKEGSEEEPEERSTEGFRPRRRFDGGMGNRRSFRERSNNRSGPRTGNRQGERTGNRRR